MNGLVFKKRINHDYCIFFPETHITYISLYMSLTFYRCKIADYPDDTFGVKDPGHQRLVEMTIPRDSMGDYEKCSFYSYQTNRTILMFNSSDLQENFTIGVNATLQKCSEWVYEKSVFKETYTSKVFFNIWYTRWF